MRHTILFLFTIMCVFALNLLQEKETNFRNATRASPTSLSFDQFMCHLHAGTKAHTNATWEAETMLFWFHSQLRSFIQETHFDFFRFGVVCGKLTEDFKKIWEHVHDVIQGDRQLLRQAEFASNMLDTMINATRVWESFESINFAHIYLLHRIIGLNIHLWGMYNPYGDLNTEIPGYMGKILNIWLKQLYWSQQFLGLKGIPYFFSELFQDQVKEVKRLTDDLLSQDADEIKPIEDISEIYG